MWSAVVPSTPVERAVDRVERVLRAPLRARLEVRLVDLDDVGAGREQVAELLVDRLGVGEGQRALVARSSRPAPAGSW